MREYLPALLTAMFWGFSYASCEFTLKTIDKKLFFFITGISTAIFWSVYFVIAKGSEKNQSIDSVSFLWLIFSICCGLLGNFFCIKAIQQMGSVKASVIEITYPIFCALFIMICNRSYSLSLMQILCMIIVIIGSAGFMLSDKK